MNRFWPRNYNFHDGNINMAITTRMPGDVPGCVPAVDVFIERTQTEVRAEIANDKHWEAYLAGDSREYNPPKRKWFISR